ncbi:MAG: adenosylmethionine--8-amino-7-oxononanoate transaminase [Victivallaceae bacterium]|nr:adenosylmethionine--8-amino-7-oxononanoate transaminase [Victivallaceae bacterium]
MMSAEAILALDRKHVWHPYDSMTNPVPVNPVVRAEGCRITLADGTTLVDALSSWWCVCHGHNHPALTEAIRRQSEKFNQVMFAGFTHEPAVRLAELLSEAAPGDLDRVFFADSGSVAVECAAKMAVQYQLARGRRSRTRMATVRGGYHGDTAGAMALCDPEGMNRLFSGLLVQHFFAEKPTCRFDGVFAEEDFASIEELIRQREGEIAGFILEPIFQGANAMNFYHPEYLRKLRALCDRYDIVLVFDEVATGFGRLGKFFAAEFAGVAPDVMCVGKGLTGGSITLSAVLTTGRIADAISRGEEGRFMHGPTFMANPLACAAGVVSLELFKQYDWAGAVGRIESKFREGLAPLRNLPQVKDVRVLGAVAVVELESLPTYEEMQRMVRSTGVWLRPFGHWLYSMPPFVIQEEELSQVISAMRLVAEGSFRGK